MPPDEMLRPAIAHALTSAWLPARISQLQQAAGYSAKHFIALFNSAVGVTPKHYYRIQRFSEVARWMAGGAGTLANIAAVCGYSDQAHLTREFRELAGVTPSRYQGHAEIRIGPATLMLSDEYPEQGIKGPRTLGGTSFSIHLHVADVDEAFERAVNAGASVVRPLKDQFYGERSGTVRDPFGHEWLLGGHLEQMSTAEMQRRYTELFKK